MEPISLYFHVPYCNNKCIYCDFYSGGARIADWNALISSFKNELGSRKSEFNGHRIVSIYFGGGTPSLVPHERLASLLDYIRDTIGVKSIADDCEITLEVNPEDVTEVNISAWKEIGINRISLGVQTFNDSLLRRIGRRHSGIEAARALERLREYFGNVSADLIFGLPGQTIVDLKKDLEMIISLNPNHISVYSLMYEPGTALTYLRDIGKIKPVEEELSAEMFEFLSAYIQGAGYERYETSNYALPGYESRHNSGYWTGRPYVGIGPAAHSYDGKSIRKANPADIKGYLLRWAGSAPLTKTFREDSFVPIIENLSREEREEEMLMLGLRMKRGVDLSEFEKRFGYESAEAVKKRALINLNSGYLELTKDNHLRITDTALMISDHIILELLPE